MVSVFQKLSTWTINPVLLQSQIQIESPSFPQEDDGLIFLDGDGAVSVMERKLTAGSRRKKNTIPARARWGESPPRSGVFVQQGRETVKGGYTHIRVAV